jgi:RHH-type transcriptional regulator, proline utilization regulon repressor / proline dehydrogenase / delta 1-pyrroline-5-carboxylate dehydrogenase
VDDGARADRAVAIADELLRAAEAGTTRAERRRQRRLGRLLADSAARDLVQRLTDEVLRLDRPRTAAHRFARLTAGGIPAAVGRGDRLSLALGARVAPLLPSVVMPIVRRRIIAETRGLVIPAEGSALSRHIRRRSRAGMQLNLNVLGEAIVSDAEAEQRIERVIAVMRRPDVDYVSVKISAVCALLDVYAFEHSVERISAALRRIYGAASSTRPPTFVNLDMEEYGDLDLTVESFLRVLDEPPHRTMPAGIVLQAYLPDSHAAIERIGGWAAQRVATGGAPIKVRIVKGANLAMEQVDAEQHGWIQAPYATKGETDASYKRLLDSCLRPEWAGAVRVGVASHNLFDVAWALTLREELPEQRRGDLDIEMLEGIVPAQSRAVRERAGSLLLYCPIVRGDEVEASLAYLARRFDENTSPENFLRAMFTMRPGSSEFDSQAERFRAAVDDRHTVAIERRRRPIDPTAGGEHPGAFVNHPDTDFTDRAHRADIAAALAKQAINGCPDGEYPMTTDVAAIDVVIAAAAAALPAWAARPPRDRAALLRAVAEQMSAERWATLAQMAAEAAKTVREGDPEVSEAIDFARYYATTEVSGGSTPYGVVVVASPWNFPYAIPAGGTLAALMAGNTVVLKPPPETRATAWLLANQCWRAGIPRDVLQYVACPDDDVGRRLITHDDVATVVLTGAYATATLFLGWKPQLRLLAETSGKNAIIVTEAADFDAAVRDVARSAFGHAGQKCSAASLLILTAAVHDGDEFLPRLAAAVRSVRVGEADDPATMMGPLIAPPAGPLLRGLTVLDDGERWLVEPRERAGSRRRDPNTDGEEITGRRWTPGVRIGVAEGSWFHQTECFGPVLGVMRADDLAHAVRLQNGTPFGLTGGIHSLDDDEVRSWLDHVEVGNAYVNRHITGAIVRRQPFGGWKRSSVGGAPKAGGPHYVEALTRRRASSIDVAAATDSYGEAWESRFAGGRDVTGLRSEANVLRYAPLPGLVVVRVGADTPAGAPDAALAAARQCGVAATVSDAAAEHEAQLAARLDSIGATRMRALTGIGDDLAAACHALDIAIDRAAVSADGSRELPHWLREQAISLTAHRYGLIRPGTVTPGLLTGSPGVALSPPARS